LAAAPPPLLIYTRTICGLWLRDKRKAALGTRESWQREDQNRKENINSGNLLPPWRSLHFPRAGPKII